MIPLEGWICAMVMKIKKGQSELQIATIWDRIRRPDEHTKHSLEQSIYSVTINNPITWKVS